LKTSITNATMEILELIDP